MAFLDELSKNISENSQLSSEIMLLNQSIKDEETKIDSIYQAIGKLYYEKHSLDCEGDFLGLVNEIKNSCQKIADYNNQIISLNNMTICPNCANLVAKGTSFCTKCGTRLEPVVIPDNSQPICKKCGAILNEGMAFCSSCGAKAEIASVQNVENEKICVNCGAVLKENSKFCVKCGMKIENTPPVIEPVAPVVEPAVEPIQPAEAVKTEENNDFTIKNVCENCGAVLMEGALFCIKCGTKVGETNVQAQPQKRYCTTCGKELSDTARFCTGCGAKI